MIHKLYDNSYIWLTRDGLTNSSGVDYFSDSLLSDYLFPEMKEILGEDPKYYLVILPEEWV